MSKPLLLVLDGHDASGKTTLATALADQIGVPCIRPFFGHRGSHMLKAAEAGNHAEVQTTALQMLAEALATPAPVQVLDRHWMTVFTLLPADHWEPWFPLPPTFLCAADLATTIARLRQRGEERVAEHRKHRYYIRLYQQLAVRFGVPVIRTNRVDQKVALQTLIRWAQSSIEKHT